MEQFAWYGIHDIHQRHPFLLPTHQPVVAELKNIESIFEIFQEAFEGNHISAKALCYNLHVECIGLILIAEGLGQSGDSSKPTAIPDKYITEAVLRYKERLAMALKINEMETDAVRFLQKFLLNLYNLCRELRRQKMYDLAVFTIEEALTQVWALIQILSLLTFLTDTEFAILVISFKVYSSVFFFQISMKLLC